MKAIVYRDMALVEGKVYKLGCACTSPRRRKNEIPSTPELIEQIKKEGHKEEVR